MYFHFYFIIIIIIIIILLQLSKSSPFALLHPAHPPHTVDQYLGINLTKEVKDLYS